MALTPSIMLHLGTSAPEIGLPDTVTGRTIWLSDMADKKALLVMFICVHCPYVVHVRDELDRLSRDYESRDLGIVAISSNDAANYPDDAPDKLAAMAQELGFTFPYCYDETQAVAKAYHAACTPDFFVYDGDHKLVYRGQLDDSRPGNGLPVTGVDLRRALDEALSGQEVTGEQKPSMGCNIKWKRGMEPDYQS